MYFTCLLCYDHHCVFTSKCVGKNNLFLFKTFIGSIVMSFIAIIIGAIMTLGYHQ